jgi:hypothetical protein
LVCGHRPAAGFATAQIHDRGIGCRVNLDVDDRGTVPAGCDGKRGGQVLLGADCRGLGAQRLRRTRVRDRAEVDRLGPALAGRALLDLDQAEGAVVEHHDRDAQPQPRGGLDLGQRHTQTAVSGERDDQPGGSTQRRGDGRGKREPHRGQAARDQQPTWLGDLPQRHDREHVSACVHGDDRLPRHVRANDADHLHRGQKTGAGRSRLGQPEHGLASGDLADVRRPVMLAGAVGQHADGRGQGDV